MHIRSLLAASGMIILLAVPPVARAAPSGASVTINSVPSGAVVYIDGKDTGAKGITSSKLKVKIKPGKHQLLLELPGYAPLEQEITVAKRGAHLYLTLNKAQEVPEKITVQATGDDAQGGQIFIDGTASGTIPGDVEVKPGQHVIEVRKQGFKPYSETVSLQKSEQKVIQVTLQAEKKSGSLVISAPHGHVYVDGVDRGPGPVTVEGLAEGEHMVEIRDNATAPPMFKQMVNVVGGRQAQMMAAMQDTPPIVQASSSSDVAELRQTVEALKLEVQELKNKPAGGVGLKATYTPGGAPAGIETLLPGLKIMGDVRLRYDWSYSEDQTEALQDPYHEFWNRLAYRFRLGFKYDNDGPVVVGFRISSGENPNPTVPFVSLGDAFRAKSIGMDQYYATIRPLQDRDRFSFTVGKMPNPVWRGDGAIADGYLLDQVMFDNDISPEGISTHITLYKSEGKKPKFKLENTLAFFELNTIQAFEFQGLTGVTFLALDQIHLDVPYFGLGIGYFDFENLNAGAISPSFSGTAAFGVPGQSAFLLRPGLNVGNNQLQLGPNSTGFVSDNFRVGSGLARVHYTFGNPTNFEKPELYFMVNYTRNFSSGITKDQNAYALSLAFHGGGYKGGVHPLNVWFTYADVDADATLAAIADSDLGGGTAYRGIEAGANYRIFRNFMAQVVYFYFKGYPLKDQGIGRLFLDLHADF